MKVTEWVNFNFTISNTTNKDSGELLHAELGDGIEDSWTMTIQAPYHEKRKVVKGDPSIRDYLQLVTEYEYQTSKIK